VSERVPSDHESIASHRSAVETVGSTSRLVVPVPDAVEMPTDEPIRVSLAGELGHARATTALDGGTILRGVYDNARQARERDGDGECLREWLAAAGLGGGDAILLDEITPGYAYGLRPPGERVVYQAVEAPSDGLSDIARDLGE
jgi:hypothetical protein